MKSNFQSLFNYRLANNIMNSPMLSLENELINSFINRVILYDDTVIIFYNSNDREVKQFTKRQLKKAEADENL